MITETNPYKLIELVGRTCYKSEDKITENSYIAFTNNLIKRKHYAMLEHGRVSCLFEFNVPNISDRMYNDINRIYQAFQPLPKCYVYVYYKGCNTKDSINVRILINCSLSHIYNDRWRTDGNQLRIAMLDAIRSNMERTYSISAEEFYQFELEYELNMVSAYKIKLITDISDVSYMINEYNNILDKLNVYTFKFTCDRAVSHELVRHRLAIAQESQRYCSYDKDKFGSEIYFVKPSNFEENWSNVNKKLFIKSCKLAESFYFKLRKSGCAPEISRTVLPNSTKTEIILTGTRDEWRHFLDLRYRQSTGKVHPDMLEIATKVANIIEK